MAFIKISYITMHARMWKIDSKEITENLYKSIHLPLVIFRFSKTNLIMEKINFDI